MGACFAPLSRMSKKESTTTEKWNHALEEYLASQCDAEAWEMALVAKSKGMGYIGMREAVRRWYTGERQEWEDDAVEVVIEK